MERSKYLGTSKVLSYLFILVAVAIFLLGVNFAFHFLRFTQLLPPSPIKYESDVRCPKVNFDYLQLTIRWPPSFCNYGHCKKGAIMYSWDIHGLWPDFKNGSYPQFCCPDYKFDLKELDPILDDLKVG